MDGELKCYQGMQETHHRMIKGFLGNSPGPGCCSCPSAAGLPCTGACNTLVLIMGQLMQLSAPPISNHVLLVLELWMEIPWARSALLTWQDLLPATLPI